MTAPRAFFTPEELADLATRIEKASPLPWWWNDISREIWSLPRKEADEDLTDKPIVESDYGVYGPTDEDAALILGAVNSLPLLLAKARDHAAIAATLAELRSVFDKMRVERDAAIAETEEVRMVLKHELETRTKERDAAEKATEAAVVEGERREAAQETLKDKAETGLAEALKLLRDVRDNVVWGWPVHRIDEFLSRHPEEPAPPR